MQRQEDTTGAVGTTGHQSSSNSIEKPVGSPPSNAIGANSYQIAGAHYKQANGGEEHWDRVNRLGLNYFQACITKYVERYKLKNGIEDLKKARHFIDKLIELEEASKP